MNHFLQFFYKIPEMFILKIPKLIQFVLLVALFYSANNYGFEKKVFKSNFQMQVSGKVTDDQNTPLLGVTVFIKGTKNGTQTDFDGNYSITAKEGDILTFSYLGMKTENVIVAVSKTINIKMKVDTAELDEIVVIGYGSVKKKNIVGSMSSVTEEDLISNPGGDALSAIQGQAAGVQIISNSGAPGAGLDIVIRGASSITGGTNPLYIIDGVQVEADGSNVAGTDADQLATIGALSFLDPNNIESINILKDASATAIYGSRGANGVVIITTKSGKFNQKSISLGYTSGVTMVPEGIELLNMDEYIELRNYRTPGNARYSTNVGTDTAPIYVPRVYPQDSIVNVDYQKQVFNPALSQQLNLTFNNGNEASNTSASIGYLKNNGLIKNTNFDRINLALRYKLNASDNLSFDSNLNASYAKASGIRYNGTGTAVSSGIVQSIINTPPGAILSPENSDGEDPEDNDLSTPLELVNDAVNNTSLANIIASLGMNYKLTDKLSFRSQVSGRLTYSETNLFYPSNLAQGRNTNGRVELESVVGERIDFQNTLNYEIPLKDVNIALLAGIESRVTQRSVRNTESYGFDLGLGGPYNIGEGINVQIPQSFKERNQGLSYFSRAQFDILDKYLFTATFRADGSSKFGINNKYGYFYSVGGAWKLKNEKFLKNIRAINNLTLRASYGTSGNDRIPNGQVNTNYNLGLYPDATDNNQVALGIANLGDPDLRWETTTQLNVGLDAAFFRNRLRFSLDAYKKQTTDLLLAAEIPAYFGQRTQISNIGRIDNDGVELSLSGFLIRNQKMRWRMLVTASRNISTIKDLGDSSERIVNTGNGIFREIGIIREGSPVGVFYGLEYDGVYDFNDFQEFDGLSREEATAIYNPNDSYTLKDGVTDIAGSTVKPGHVKFKNLTDDDGQTNIITGQDRTIIGDGNPDVFGGITNVLQFGKLGINININYSLGADIFNASKIFTNGIRSLNHNITREYYNNFWRPENANFTEPGILDVGNNGLERESSYYVEDGSFMRLKRVHITYSLGDVLSKYGVEDLTVFVSGNDLLTITGYKGFDPEVRSNFTLVRGIDRASYPRAATVSLGVNVKF